jgi:hypothetical protein
MRKWERFEEDRRTGDKEWVTGVRRAKNEGGDKSDGA